MNIIQQACQICNAFNIFFNHKFTIYDLYDTHINILIKCCILCQYFVTTCSTTCQLVLIKHSYMRQSILEHVVLSRMSMLCHLSQRHQSTTSCACKTAQMMHNKLAQQTCDVFA